MAIVLLLPSLPQPCSPLSLSKGCALYIHKRYTGLFCIFFSVIINIPFNGHKCYYTIHFIFKMYSIDYCLRKKCETMQPGNSPKLSLFIHMPHLNRECF